jgi:chemotaxis protein MotB
MRKKKKKQQEEEKRDLFIVCFTALSLILLAFFICLNSMATLTEERVQNGIYSVKTAFGVLPGSRPGFGNRPVPVETYSVEGITEELIDRFLKGINELNLGNDVFLGVISRGLVLSLSGDLLFSKGSTKLNPKAIPLLHKAADMIRSCTNRIRIEGHADNSPVRGIRFSSNFEISAARAISVLRYFTEVEKIPENRFYAVGCGQYRPLFPNDSPEHRAKNRRVWIVFEGKPKKKHSDEINIHGFNFKIGGL